MMLLLGMETLHACEFKNSEYRIYMSCKEVKTVTSNSAMLKCCKNHGIGVFWLSAAEIKKERKLTTPPR